MTKREQFHQALDALNKYKGAKGIDPEQFKKDLENAAIAMRESSEELVAQAHEIANGRKGWQ
jgi:hypothetical protein